MEQWTVYMFVSHMCFLISGNSSITKTIHFEHSFFISQQKFIQNAKNAKKSNIPYYLHFYVSLVCVCVYACGWHTPELFGLICWARIGLSVQWKYLANKHMRTVSITIWQIATLYSFVYVSAPKLFLMFQSTGFNHYLLRLACKSGEHRCQIKMNFWHFSPNKIAIHPPMCLFTMFALIISFLFAQAKWLKFLSIDEQQQSMFIISLR